MRDSGLSAPPCLPLVSNLQGGHELKTSGASSTSVIFQVGGRKRGRRARVHLASESLKRIIPEALANDLHLCFTGYLSSRSEGGKGRPWVGCIVAQSTLYVPQRRKYWSRLANKQILSRQQSFYCKCHLDRLNRIWYTIYGFTHTYYDIKTCMGIISNLEQ